MPEAAGEDGTPRIAVIGAGAAGLTCAYRLSQAGVAVDVYERWPGLGGQAATLDVGDGLRLERYYHYLFTSDRALIDLFEELGLVGILDRHELRTAIALDGRIWPFNGALDLLRFRPLPWWTRLRMGAALAWMQLGRGDVTKYERVTARAWIERMMGRPAWEKVWGPMMRGKFGERADEISMAWIGDKLLKRRSIREGEARQEAFIYPRGGWEPLFQGLAERIVAAGGRVMIDRPAARVLREDGSLAVVPAAAGSFRSGLDPSGFEPDGPPERYDAVICCVPNDVFAALLDDALAVEVGAEYLERLESIEYFAAFNLLLELERPLTEHFWVNVADRRCPFVGLIEHTNLVGPQATGGRVFSHVINYLPGDHELLALDPDAVLDRYEEGLRLLNPGFERSWVRSRWLFREPSAQPIVGVGYRERIPSRQTPASGLMLVNTTQIYPEDRGTNYAVRDGTAAAEEVLTGLSDAARPAATAPRGVERQAG
ncbi:MAG: NAD(P)/FAD-dependent oxidoreductase [Solirubrobacterales bacterium]